MQIDLIKLTHEFMVRTQHLGMLTSISLQSMLIEAAYKSLTEEEQLAYKGGLNEFGIQVATAGVAYTRSQMTPQQLEEADALARKFGLD